MDGDAYNARADRGLALLTAHLTRDSDGTLNEASFRSILGNNISDDDLIGGLADMVLAAELVMRSYQVKTGLTPMEVLQEIALYRERRRSE